MPSLRLLQKDLRGSTPRQTHHVSLGIPAIIRPNSYTLLQMEASFRASLDSFQSSSTNDSPFVTTK